MIHLMNPSLFRYKVDAERGTRPSFQCHVCNGVGRIHTTSKLEVRIPPHVDDSTYIDVDLIKIRPDKLTSFNLKSLRIKISILKAVP